MKHGLWSAERFRVSGPTERSCVGWVAAAIVFVAVVVSTPAVAEVRSDDVAQALNWKTTWMPTPMMALGPCKTPPTIDGKLDPGEWDDACAISTLSAHGGAYAYPTALVYVTYDANRLYFGYLRYKDKPGWFSAASRFRDSATYMDPHIELFLSPDPGAGKDLLYQFCINAYGAVYDIINVPAFGQTSPGYNPKIQFKTSETQSDFYIEGYIDVKDLDPQGRFRDGAVWKANFCWAWPEIAWATHGIFWLVRDNMGVLKLDSSAPALQWLDAYPLQEGRLDIKVGLKNTTADAQSYVVSAVVTGETDKDIISTAEERISLKSGERQEFQLKGDGRFEGKRGHVNLTCTSADGTKTYYQQYMAIDPKNAGALDKTREAMKTVLPMPKTMAVTVRYGPLSNAAEVQVDVWNFRRSGTDLDHVHAWVEPQSQPGKRLVETDLKHFQKDLALWKCDLPKDAPYGKYVVKAQALSSEGKVISESSADFDRLNLKDSSVDKPYQGREGHILDWIGTKCGVATQVPPPWTPVKVDAKQGVQVLNREITLDGSGLPEQVEAVGENILAGPVRYVAVVNGKSVELKTGKAGGFASDKAGLWASWEGSTGNKDLRLTSRAKIEYDGLINYRLDISCPKPLALDALYLDIPIRKDLAKWINLPASHAELPGGDGGLVWKSKDVVDNELMNTLVSHVWIGNWKCGITFIADQTKGWYEQDGQSLETVERGDDAVHIKVYFVQGPRQVESTSLTFALMPTPSTERPKGWRNYPNHAGKEYFWVMDWWDDRKYEERPGNSIPFWNWDDPPGAEVDKLKTEDWTTNGRLGLPYTNPWFHYPAVVPWELADASPVPAIMLEEWANMPSRWGFVRPVASERDYMTYNYDWYFRMKRYAGFYIDEAYGAEKEDINMLNGSGWFDRNGNLRGSYHSMDVRELFKRQYVIGMQYSPLHEPFMLNHTSWGQSPQYMSHVTCGIFVENLPIGPGECYLDHMPLSTLQFWSGRAWGNFSSVTGIGPDASSQRYCVGELALHDVRESWTPDNIFKQIGKEFGIGEDDVDFFGYWEEPKVASSDDDIKASAYRRPGSVLLVVCNVDTKAGHKSDIKVDSRALGLPANFKASDYETDKPLTVENGAISLDLPARGVRYLHIY